MKKAFFLVIILALFMLAGCSNNRQIKLTLWTIDFSGNESINASFLKTLEEFREAYPHINVVLDTGTGITANKFPDVFFNYAEGRMKSFANTGGLLPLNDYLDQEVWDRILGGTLTDLTFDENVYGLPFTLACSVLFVNREMYCRYNLKIPETWDEFLFSVRTFIRAGIIPMTAGGGDRLHTSMFMDLLMLRAAGYQECYDTFNKTENGTFLSSGIKLAAEKFDELKRAGAFPENITALTREESEELFYAGVIPIYVNTNWTAANSRVFTSVVKENVIAIPFPVIPGAPGQLHDFLGGADGLFSVHANTRHKEAAVLLCQFLAENLSKNAYLAGVGIPAWKHDMEIPEADPLIASIISMTDNAESFLLWGNAILESKDSEAFMDISHEMLMGSITPDEFVNKLQTAIYR